MSHLTTKPTNWLCAQPKLRSDWADAQADLSLRWTNMFFVGFVVTRLIFTWKYNERTAKSLIRLGGCPGWSESSLDEHAFCWFCRDEAHIYLETWILLLQDAAWSLYTLSWVVLCWLFNYWSFTSGIVRMMQMLIFSFPIPICLSARRSCWQLWRVKRICVFEHSVMTNFNCACPVIQRGQGSGFLFEGSSWLTACMSEQRRFWRDCAARR